jgi:hypothetical protein
MVMSAVALRWDIARGETTLGRAHLYYICYNPLSLYMTRAPGAMTRFFTFVWGRPGVSHAVFIYKDSCRHDDIWILPQLYGRLFITGSLPQKPSSRFQTRDYVKRNGIHGRKAWFLLFAVCCGDDKNACDVWTQMQRRYKVSDAEGKVWQTWNQGIAKANRAEAYDSKS